ncbi:benzoylformate decarboxylase [Rhodopseudomonas rhenobacensis]|uniref:Benzoylformate decarboxylase n=1 Tax=Rhodopseudomonas rhenobacensis TaxID=87461 RepID=A0A7W7Z6B5_9BRAD|nr:thiamine pyrophosphate-binding protein [Rhodopseudomonas rhenobacensis]MBB5048820.1 benzoylformate decarboxylase [Rhodopseudomonas rhenobacensis]
MTRPASDILLDILRDEGITHVFGNPGSTEMPLMDALVDAPDINYVLGLQEATAVGMADGWALTSGKTGFVNLHAMGGLGNAMGVLVASKASETPLVVTAGQQDTRHLATEPWLSGDLVALAAPVTKWAKEVRRGEDLGAALRRAFAIARTPPCGPVFLSLPMDVLDQPVEGPTPPASAPPRLGPSPDSDSFAEALARHDPEKVFVLLGDDLPAPAAAGLVAFAEAGGYAVAGMQLTSRSAFPSAHPCWAGVLKPDFAAIRERLERVEALVLVGGRAFVAYPYRDVRPIPDGVQILHVADNPDAFGREHPAHMALLGDIGATLQSAAARLGGLLDRDSVMARLAQRDATKQAQIAKTRAEILSTAHETPLSPDAAVLTVSDALPDNTLLANDSAATFGQVQDLLMTRPGRYFFARGGVLGCNMPAAVGAALLHDGPVASLVGDGGAMYSPQALWSAARYRAKVLFIVFNNRRYGVLQNIAKQLGCKNAVAGRFVGMDVDDPAIDFMALSTSMGVPSVKADTPDAIRAAIAEALDRDGPSLIEIAVK